MFKKNLYFCEKLNPQKWGLITEIKHLNWFIGPVHESKQQPSLQNNLLIKRLQSNVYSSYVSDRKTSVARRQEQNQPGL